MKKAITEFKLGAVTWSVKVDNLSLADKNALGECNYSESKILLDDRNQEIMDETLWHEVVHAILRSLGEIELSEDERFVQSVSVLLNQYHKTRK